MSDHNIKNQEAYRALFELASDCIIVVDFAGNINDANECACRVLGYSRDELVHMPMSVLMDPEDLRLQPFRFEQLDNGTQLFSERRMIVKGGDILEVEANVKKFGASNIMAIIRDVTERNKSRERLQLAYERLNYHLNNTPLAVIEEDKNFHITYWNRQAELIFGWKSEEVLGRRVVDFMVDPGDRGEVNDLIENLGKGIRNKQPNENRNLTKSGKLRNCQWYHSLLLDHGGEVSTILSIVLDITDIRSKEEKIQQYLVFLKELSFVTSHDLRNEYVKVQSVLNYLESAQEEGRELDERDRKFLLKEATQAFYNINDVIGKLNDKIISGQDLVGN